MSKSVLVIDTPEDCMHCLLLTGSDERMLQDENTNFNADTLDELIQTCPLKFIAREEKHDCTSEQLRGSEEFTCGRLECLH